MKCCPQVDWSGIAVNNNSWFHARHPKTLRWARHQPTKEFDYNWEAVKRKKIIAVFIVISAVAIFFGPIRSWAGMYHKDPPEIDGFVIDAKTKKPIGNAQTTIRCECFCSNWKQKDQCCKMQLADPILHLAALIPL
jgi:hypothetical protein